MRCKGTAFSPSHQIFSSILGWKPNNLCNFAPKSVVNEEKKRQNNGLGDDFGGMHRALRGHTNPFVQQQHLPPFLPFPDHRRDSGRRKRREKWQQILIVPILAQLIFAVIFHAFYDDHYPGDGQEKAGKEEDVAVGQTGWYARAERDASHQNHHPTRCFDVFFLHWLPILVRSYKGYLVFNPKLRKKFGGMEKKQYLCTAFSQKFF